MRRHTRLERLQQVTVERILFWAMVLSDTFLRLDFAMTPLYGRRLCTAPVFLRPGQVSRSLETPARAG